MVLKLFAAFRGLAYASVFVLVWWWVVDWARSFDGELRWSLPAWLRGPGVVLVALGVALALYCVGAFALAGKGTPAPFDPPREFVAVGPYRYLRNPMYVGGLAVLLGASLILRSPSALAVALFFILVAHLFVLLYEEPALERRFGPSYRQYKSSVNRWIPRNPRGGEARNG